MSKSPRSPLHSLHRSGAAVASLAALLMLSGCDASGQADSVSENGRATPTPPPAPPPIETGPTATPKSGLDDATIAEFEGQEAAKDDFIVKFGEPFIGFETREDQVLVSDHTSGQRYAFVTAANRQVSGEAVTFRPVLSSPWDETTSQPKLTIERKTCDDEFSGEITYYTAWMTSEGRDYRLRGCARIVGTQQRWPDGVEP